MNLPFFNKSKKKILNYVAIFLTLLLFSALNPALRPALVNSLKLPLILFNLLKRESTGILFYHRNLILAERSQRQIDFLRRKLIDSEELSLENIRLNRLLELQDQSSYKVIAARVIARSTDNWSSNIIINKGSASGIKTGMAAINYLGLVGRVVAVSYSSSQVILISDPNLSVSSICQRSRQEGLVSGTLGSNLLMKYLPKDADIKVSDKIITSGLTDIYPKGIFVGAVINVGEELSGLTRYALIKPAVNLSNVEEVLIIVR